MNTSQKRLVIAQLDLGYLDRSQRSLLAIHLIRKFGPSTSEHIFSANRVVATLRDAGVSSPLAVGYAKLFSDSDEARRIRNKMIQGFREKIPPSRAKELADNVVAAASNWGDVSSINFLFQMSYQSLYFGVPFRVLIEVLNENATIDSSEVFASRCIAMAKVINPQISFSETDLISKLSIQASNDVL